MITIFKNNKNYVSSLMIVIQVALMVESDKYYICILIIAVLIINESFFYKFKHQCDHGAVLIKKLILV